MLLVLVPASILLVALFTTTGVVMVEALEDRFPRPSADPLDVQCAIILGVVLPTTLIQSEGDTK